MRLEDDFTYRTRRPSAFSPYGVPDKPTISALFTTFIRIIAFYHMSNSENFPIWIRVSKGLSGSAAWQMALPERPFGTRIPYGKKFSLSSNSRYFFIFSRRYSLISYSLKRATEFYRSPLKFLIYFKPKLFLHSRNQIRQIHIFFCWFHIIDKQIGSITFHFNAEINITPF